MPSHATSRDTSTSTFEPNPLVLRLHGDALPVQTWRYATPEDRPDDPTLLPAGNDYSWDYSQGNPPNPAVQTDASFRPNGSNLVVSALIGIVFRGVNAIGTVNRIWTGTGQKVFGDHIWTYKKAVQDPL